MGSEAGVGGVVSVLKGLDKRAASESTPIFDQLMEQVGSLFDDAPWLPEHTAFQPWELPKDYELPPLPLHVAIEQTRRRISASWDTQLMEVISGG